MILPTYSDTTDRLPPKLRAFFRTTDLNLCPREALHYLARNYSEEELIEYYTALEKERRATFYNGMGIYP